METTLMGGLGGVRSGAFRAFRAYRVLGFRW